MWLNYQLIKWFFLSSRWISDTIQDPKKRSQSALIVWFIEFAAPKRSPKVPHRNWWGKHDENSRMFKNNLLSTMIMLMMSKKASRWVESGRNVEGCKTHSHDMARTNDRFPTCCTDSNSQWILPESSDHAWVLVQFLVHVIQTARNSKLQVTSHVQPWGKGAACRQLWTPRGWCA